MGGVDAALSGLELYQEQLNGLERGVGKENGGGDLISTAVLIHKPGSDSGFAAVDAFGELGLAA